MPSQPAEGMQAACAVNARRSLTGSGSGRIDESCRRAGHPSRTRLSSPGCVTSSAAETGPRFSPRERWTMSLPPDDPVQGVVAVNLSGRLLRAYLRHGGIGLLSEAAGRCRRVLASECYARGHVLANLALVLNEESSATGDPVLVDGPSRPG